MKIPIMDAMVLGSTLVQEKRTVYVRPPQEGRNNLCGCALTILAAGCGWSAKEIWKLVVAASGSEAAVTEAYARLLGLPFDVALEIDRAHAGGRGTALQIARRLKSFEVDMRPIKNEIEGAEAHDRGAELAIH